MFTSHELILVNWAVHERLKDIDNEIATSNNAVNLCDLAEDLAEYEKLYAKVVELINKDT